MNKRAVSYARVSSDDRGKDNRNLTGQLEMCREYALQQGWTIIAELAEDDRGTSGASFELPQLNKVREMARNKEFDILVVREIDRLSRKLAKQLVVEEELTRMGIQIVYVLADYDDSPEGRLSKHIRATIAEYEREKITERMIRGRVLKVRAGHVMIHNIPPYGYKVSINEQGKTTLVGNEDEAKIVRMVYNWYVNGYNGEQITIIGISKKLTEMGFPTRYDTMINGKGVKQRAWGIWSPSMVAKILKSEVYIGNWYYRKNKHSKEEWLAISVPPLVTEEIWHQVQKIGERNKAQARASRKHQYLLTCHIRCGLCGSRMNGHPAHWHSKNAHGVNYYYRCMANDGTKVNIKCNLPQFKLERVDAAVWQWVTEFLTNPELLEEGMAVYQAEQEIRNEGVIERLTIIDELLTDHKAQLTRILDLYLGGDFPKELLVDKKARLEQTIRSLESEKLDLHDFLEKKTLTPEQCQDIEEFSRKILEGINLLSCDFKTKRQIIELLDIQVTCLIDNDGKQFVNLKCILGSEQYSLSTSSQCEILDQSVS